MSLLQNHSYKWNEIGLELGFITSELQTISSMSRLFIGAPVSYLQELFSQWLQWPTDSHPSKPTLEALCAALRSSLVGLGSLAEMVIGRMKPVTGNFFMLYYFTWNEIIADFADIYGGVSHLF